MNRHSIIGDSRSRRRCAGMTLPELLVALGLGGIVLAAVALLSVYSSRSFVAMGNYVDLDMDSRAALDKMLREIRQARALTAFAPDELTFLDVDGVTLKYKWSTNTGQLTRERPAGSTPEVLLTGCDSLSFSMYSRVPQPGTNNFTATADPATCKLIDISWKCSRTILGKKVNTESVQTAQIVLRNKRIN